MDQTPVKPAIGAYQNKPILILNPGEKYQFSFGLSKARMIISNIKAIQKFVESEGQECE